MSTGYNAYGKQMNAATASSYASKVSSQIKSAYTNTDIETADRGQLIVMIYDHCIKWCKKAVEAVDNNKIELRTKAIFKVQDGITELSCALDHDKGGDIAQNLYWLYEFYNYHLSEANLKNNKEHIVQIQEMLQTLREAWMDAADQCRKSGSVDMRVNQKSYVSIVG
ncbi:MAG: flagellar export chaperone FliS [Fibrobacterales bacterium]